MYTIIQYNTDIQKYNIIQTYNVYTIIQYNTDIQFYNTIQIYNNSIYYRCTILQYNTYI